MVSKLRVLDLFSGIGGFSLGLERTGGFETVAFCEIEPFPRRVLAKHWPGVPIYDDVRTLTGERLRADGISVDVICGGFPCQDISTAGKGAGMEGARSGLWSEYARLVRELRPQFVVVENVAALASRGLGRVLGDLAEGGYDAEWDCIPACAVGAPHRRDRIWIVAYPDACLHAGGLVGRGNPDPATRGPGRDACQGQAPDGEWLWSEPRSGSAPVANTDRRRQPQSQGRIGDIGRRVGDGGSDVAHAERERRGQVVKRVFGRAQGEGASDPIDDPGFARWRQWWGTEPDVGRVADGVPARVDRLKSLGNAVVPQIPELIGRAILESLEAA